jgi:hypothetical protein
MNQIITMKNEEIISILTKELPYLKERHGIKSLGLFGSYAKGKQREGSDIDILVEFEPNTKIDLLTFIEIENYLSNRLDANVDLVMKSALKPRIGKHILEEVTYL